eukprot:IDg14452t1
MLEYSPAAELSYTVPWQDVKLDLILYSARFSEFHIVVPCRAALRNVACLLYAVRILQRAYKALKVSADIRAIENIRVSIQ